VGILVLYYCRDYCFACILWEINMIKIHRPVEVSEDSAHPNLAHRSYMNHCSNIAAILAAGVRAGHEPTDYNVRESIEYYLKITQALTVKENY
jgi:hypothetical protein